MSKWAACTIMQDIRPLKWALIVGELKKRFKLDPKRYKALAEWTETRTAA